MSKRVTGKILQWGKNVLIPLIFVVAEGLSTYGITRKVRKKGMNGLEACNAQQIRGFRRPLTNVAGVQPHVAYCARPNPALSAATMRMANSIE